MIKYQNGKRQVLSLFGLVAALAVAPCFAQQKPIQWDTRVERSPAATVQPGNASSAFLPGKAAAAAPAASGAVLISQIYASGGNAGALYRNDFIELHNNGPTPVSLKGWSLQYASANGMFGGIINPLPDRVLAPGAYLLVQEAGGPVGQALPTPDVVGNLALSASAGKVALVRDSQPLGGACPKSANIADMVGYGNTNCAEGSPARMPGSTTALMRQGAGREDTHNNSIDFVLAAPAPRNSAVMGAQPAPGAGKSGPAAAGAIVISQIYGAGGNAGASMRNDYIELYNRGNRPVSLAGWSLQYASANGVFGGQITQLPSAVLAPGAYFLVQQASGGASGAALPSPDMTGTLNLSASAGKVALVRDAVALTGVCPTGVSIVDMVGYGSTNCARGKPTPAPTSTTALHRQGDGRIDTSNNAMDFALAPAQPHRR
jgi:trimeric autotransporter adhesin